jgi:hypothetical protein
MIRSYHSSIPAFVPVGVQSQGAHHGVGEAALLEEPRDAVVDAGEVQAPPIASLARWNDRPAAEAARAPRGLGIRTSSRG